MQSSPFIDALKAEDLDNLLEHIAWSDTVKPKLLAERDRFTRLLVSSTLGVPVQTETAAGAVTITREQLAGKIFGIDYILTLFEKILTRGELAATELKKLGLSL